MATKYDPEILQAYADRLYRKARWCSVRYGAGGFLVGWVGSAILLAAIYSAARSPASPMPGAIVVGVIVALLGFAYGHNKAFHLRLEAQHTLCQMQIERNTRPALATAEHRKTTEETAPLLTNQGKPTRPEQVTPPPPAVKSETKQVPEAEHEKGKPKTGDIFGLA